MNDNNEDVNDGNYSDNNKTLNTRKSNDKDCRTIWHQHNKIENFHQELKTDNLAPGRFSTRTIWHRKIWHQDNLAPNI